MVIGPLFWGPIFSRVHHGTVTGHRIDAPGSVLEVCPARIACFNPIPLPVIPGEPA